MARGEPQLNRDYWDAIYILVDNDGEPVSDYHMDLNRLRDLRNRVYEFDGYRIYRCGMRVFCDEPELVE